MNNEKIAVLMATYNGEKYIEEQIDSILNQTYKNIVLYIRDDNSKDNTVEIVKKYEEMYPEKVILVNDQKKASGACKNFMFLLEYVYKLDKYEYFMFSDQDDFWIEDKISTMIEEYDKIVNKDEPILIHSDLQVVDSKLNVINNSFIEYSGEEKKYDGFFRYLFQNNVTGCTMFINKKLVDLIKFNIDNIFMHDWYFALIASSLGQVIFVDKSIIKYRQHENNVIGANKVDSRHIFKKLKNNIKNNPIRQNFYRCISQAESFKNAYYNLLKEKDKEVLTEFCKIRNVGKITKWRIILKYKFYQKNIVKFIGEMLFI